MRRCRTLRKDSASDVHRQNIQKARAMARMEIYDGLTRSSRDFYKIRPLPIKPDEDAICKAAERAGVYFNKAGRMIVPGEVNG